MSHLSTRVTDRRIKVAELVLRCIICGFGVLTAALIGFDSQTKVIISIQKRATYTDMKALVFLVVASGIGAAYSFVQGLSCAVSLVRGSVIFSKPLAWAIFSADQLMSYLMLAAVAAATQSSVLAKFGHTELGWMKICNMFEHFCNQIAEGIASGLIASMAMIVLTIISAFSLFRLYSRNQNKSVSQ